MRMRAPTPETHQKLMKGPAFIVAAMALFALLDANSKLLSGRYAADQVILVR